MFRKKGKERPAVAPSAQRFRKRRQRMRQVLRYPRVRVALLLSAAALVATLVWLPIMLSGVGAVLAGTSIRIVIQSAIDDHEAQAYHDGHAERLRKQREK